MRFTLLAVKPEVTLAATAALTLTALAVVTHVVIAKGILEVLFEDNKENKKEAQV